MLFSSGVFPTCNHDGEPITLTLAQQLRVRRLVAVLKAHDVAYLCELVQCRTGDDYPT